MNPDEIKQHIESQVQQEVARQMKAYQDSPDGSEVANHVHNGIDSQRIPFPKNVIGTVLTAAIPTGYGKDGDIIITNIGGTRKINGRASGVWYGVAIT